MRRVTVSGGCGALALLGVACGGGTSALPGSASGDGQGAGGSGGATASVTGGAADSRCGDARPGETLWARSYGDEEATQEITSVAAAPDGVFVGGRFGSQIDLGGPVLTATADDMQTFAARLDHEGTARWSRAFSVPVAYAYVLGMAPHEDGSVTMTGRFAGEVDFGGGPLVSAGSDDILLVQLDADGHHVWSRKYGDAMGQRGLAIAAMPGGGFVAAGIFGGTIDLGDGPISAEYPAEPWGGYVAVFDAVGTLQWKRRLRGLPIAVATDARGSIAVAGQALTSRELGVDGAYVMSLLPDGSADWSLAASAASLHTAMSVAVEPDGDVLVAGWFESSIDLGFGELAAAGGPYDEDYFVVGIGAGGRPRFARAFGDAAQQYHGPYVAAGVAGRAIVTGAMSTGLDFGGGALPEPAHFDAFVVALSETGEHVYSLPLPAASGQYPWGLSTDACGDAVVGGVFWGDADFGLGPISGGIWGDAYLVRLAR